MCSRLIFLNFFRHQKSEKHGFEACLNLTSNKSKIDIDGYETVKPQIIIYNIQIIVFGIQTVIPRFEVSYLRLSPYSW